MKPLNLRHMSFKQTLVEAKDRSGLKNEEIANRSGIGASQIARYFNLYDNYYPAAEQIPVLCRVLGNTLISDWFSAQVQDMEQNLALGSTQDLAVVIMQTTQNNGKLAKLGIDALADMNLSQQEARNLQAQIRENVMLLNKLDGALEPIAKGDRS